MKNSQPVTIWQIGRENSRAKMKPKPGNWFSEYNYTLECDRDPINAPSIPQLIAMPPANISGEGTLSTAKLNIYFTLDRHYRANDLTLTYGCFSCIETRFFLDGKPLLVPNAKSSDSLSKTLRKRELNQLEISLPAISIGDHILKISVSGEQTSPDDRVISYLKLTALRGEDVDLLPIREDWTTWIGDKKLLNIWNMIW